MQHTPASGLSHRRDHDDATQRGDSLIGLTAGKGPLASRRDCDRCRAIDVTGHESGGRAVTHMGVATVETSANTWAARPLWFPPNRGGLLYAASRMGAAVFS